MDYRVVKKSWQEVQTFWYRASVWRSACDGQTDGRTDVQPISITSFGIADARKNCTGRLWVKRNSKWRPTPSWIYFRWLFLTSCRLSTVDRNHHTKFRANISIHDWIIITFVNWRWGNANAADICRSCSEDQWHKLPWCTSHSTATACRAGDLGRLLRLAARHSVLQRTAHATSWKGDTRVHCTRPVAPTVQILTQCGLQDMGRNAAAGLPYKGSWPGWTEVASYRCGYGLGQNIIDDAIYEWCKCMRACIRVKGIRHFEHLLWLKDTHMITLVC